VRNRLEPPLGQLWSGIIGKSRAESRIRDGVVAEKKSFNLNSTIAGGSVPLIQDVAKRVPSENQKCLSISK
jgi:hypothetical protein